MKHSPALNPSFGQHHDGCSMSIGNEALPGTIKINRSDLFHSGDPWGFHIHKTKHCKHHITVIRGMPNIKCDNRSIAATDFPALSCGIPSMSFANNIELKP